MLKKIAVGLIIILAIFAFLPTDIIDILGKFALGWMVMDLVNYFFGE